MLEKRLTLLGCTAIEDALQQGVPHAISDLLKAGIRVWMLTGDKSETAIQIGKSCNLIPSPSVEYRGSASAGNAGGAAIASEGGEATAVTIRNVAGGAPSSAHDVTFFNANSSLLPPTPADASPTQIFTIKASTELELSAQLRALASALGEKNVLGIGSPLATSTDGGIAGPRFSIVVDGIATLNLLLNHYPYNETFASLSTSPRVVSVLCCRCTPQQKASIVRLLKSPTCGNLTTLAIGDGGNDVGMITTADVGVGLEGNEGKHAARAADFALPQFRLLPRLILVHGRLSYYRTALIASYTFYKSACIGLIQLFYNCWCGYSGCSLLDSFALTSYNMVFTFVPAIMMTVDVDVLAAAASPSSQSSPLSSLRALFSMARLKGLLETAQETFYLSFVGKGTRDGTTPPPKQQQEAATTLLRRPHLYSSKGDFLSFRGFALNWLGRALYQSLALLFIFVWGASASDGSSLDQQSLSYGVFTSLVILQLVTVVFSMGSPTALNVLTSVAFGALYLFLLALKDLASGGVSISSFFGNPSVLTAACLAMVVCSLGWLVPLPPGVCAPSSVSELVAGIKGLAQRLFTAAKRSTSNSAGGNGGSGGGARRTTSSRSHDSAEDEEAGTGINDEEEEEEDESNVDERTALAAKEGSRNNSNSNGKAISSRRGGVTGGDNSASANNLRAVLSSNAMTTTTTSNKDDE
jgi:magnesium-transporting ATPase (P-type)